MDQEIQDQNDQADLITATRETLSSNWQEIRKLIDWMAAPNMAQYVNGLVSEKPLEQGGHWAAYAYEKYVLPLLRRRNDSQGKDVKLSMMSLGCGSGHIDHSLISQFKWPIGSFLGLEYDRLLRQHAQNLFKTIPDCYSSFHFFDFNSGNKSNGQFDIVFVCHALHHATNLEMLLPYINNSLKEDGLLIGIDYFGPTRFQIEHDVLPIIEELFSILPPSLRRDLRDPHGKVQEKFVAPTIKEVRDADLSEAVRSSDLRTLLFANFIVQDIRPMGGTLLRWLLQYRAGNFRHDIPEHVTIIKLLQYIEKELITQQKIKSDDLFFVLNRSKRL